MKTSVEPLEGNKVKVSVEVDESEFEHDLDKAFKRIAREVRIPGFRPGKAPRRIIESRIGVGPAREDALRQSLPDYYAQAVREHDIDVIAAPEIDITAGEEEGPVAFDAVVEVRPVVIVGGYASLRVTVERPEATDDDITAQIDRLREQASELVGGRPSRRRWRPRQHRHHRHAERRGAARPHRRRLPLRGRHRRGRPRARRRSSAAPRSATSSSSPPPTPTPTRTPSTSGSS